MNEGIPSSDAFSGSRLTTELPWLALVVAGVLAPLLAVIATGHTLAWRDTSQLFGSLRPLIAESLRQGQLPLWNPYEATGMPLFAQMMHGVLHPWSLLAALLSPAGSMDLLIVLHVVAGATGAGVLARYMGASRNGAAVAGLGYGLSGYLLGMSAVIQYLAAAGTAPWALLGVLAAAGGGAVAFGLGAVAMAVLLFAGDPQWALVVAALAMPLAWEKSGWKGVGRSVAATVVGGALAGIQLIPTWEYLHASDRSAGISSMDAVQWALSPARLLEFVTPGFFSGRLGAAASPIFLWLGGKSAYPQPFLPSVFVGFPLLLLAVAGYRRNRMCRYLGWSVLVFLWLALGHYLGASQLLGWVPVWGSFRYAEKLIGPFTLCLSLLAGLGLEPFAAELPRHRFAAVAAGGAALLAIASFAAVRVLPAPAAVPADAWLQLGASMAVGGVLLMLFCTVIAIGRKKGLEATTGGGTRLLVGIVLLTGLAGSAAALHGGSTLSQSHLPLPELQATGEVPRIITPVLDIAAPVDKGFDEYDAMQAVASRVGVAPYAAPSRIDAFSTYTGLLPRRYSEMAKALSLFGVERWAAYRMFAVTHAVIASPRTPGDIEAARVATSGGKQVDNNSEWDFSVWEVPHAPWVYFAQSVRPVSDDAGAVAAVVDQLRSGGGDVVLQGALPHALSPGRVLAVKRSPRKVSIVAESPGDGLLVVNDAYWDGWQATIDGKPVAIGIANGLVRAIPWPMGRHALEMSYRPAEVELGEWVSLGTAVLLLAYVVWQRRVRRDMPC